MKRVRLSIAAPRLLAQEAAIAATALVGVGKGTIIPTVVSRAAMDADESAVRDSLGAVPESMNGGDNEWLQNVRRKVPVAGSGHNRNLLTLD